MTEGGGGEAGDWIWQSTVTAWVKTQELSMLGEPTSKDPCNVPRGYGIHRGRCEVIRGGPLSSGLCEPQCPLFLVQLCCVSWRWSESRSAFVASLRISKLVGAPCLSTY